MNIPTLTNTPPTSLASDNTPVNLADRVAGQAAPLSGDDLCQKGIYAIMFTSFESQMLCPDPDAPDAPPALDTQLI